MAVIVLSANARSWYSHISFSLLLYSPWHWTWSQLIDLRILKRILRHPPVAADTSFAKEDSRFASLAESR
jgi:hypothetical protein